MQEQDILASFIEVGIGIAGFSSIVVALSRAQITDGIKAAFLQIWIQSGAIIVFSAVPMLLASADLESRAVFVWSSAMYCGFLAVALFFGPARKRYSNHPVLLLAFAFPVTLLFNAIYLGQAWPYLLVLLGGVFFAFLSFYQLIRDMWAGTPGR